jgi:hypothetical protein
VAFWQAVLDGLKKAEIPTAFLPVFNNLRAYAQAFAPICYGMSEWGNRDPESVDRDASIEDWRKLRGQGPVWMKAIREKAQYAHVITWNDYSEATETEPSSGTQFLFYDLAAYFISWFKLGRPPRIMQRSAREMRCSGQRRAPDLSSFRPRPVSAGRFFESYATASPSWKRSATGISAIILQRKTRCMREGRATVRSSGVGIGIKVRKGADHPGGLNNTLSKIFNSLSISIYDNKFIFLKKYLSMKIAQTQYVDNQWRTDLIPDGFDFQKAQLVLAFGDPALVTNAGLFDHIRNLFPGAAIVSSSTAGEILQENVYDNSLVVTAIQFEKTIVRCKVSNIKQHDSSYTTGMYLMKALVGEGEDLIAVFILSDGTHINGSELVSGFSENNPKCVPVTGGLAGDGARFTRTFAGLDRLPEEGNVVAVGFYGKNLKIGHGSFGGWDEFGPERTITRANKNVLYEIDNKNALDLYKEYLGPYKEELPGSALLFPLSMREPGSVEHLVRTILSINEREKSMLFAGNMPEGSKIRLMKANFDRLIDGSSTAARNSFSSLENSSPELTLLVSCVGRKLILQERTDEEVQAVKQIFGDRTSVAGFYSYGEISPFNRNTRCELHNQTMTITTFSES